MNGLWAKVLEKVLQIYAGHIQQRDLASESEHVFSNHISFKKTHMLAWRARQEPLLNLHTYITSQYSKTVNMNSNFIDK